MKLLVVKLSSLAVTKPRGGVDTKKIKNIVSDLASLQSKSTKLILVSSGAINAGKNLLKNSESNMSSLQASSAVGQPILMQAYSKEFKKYNLSCAQVLLTHDDFKHKERSLNIRSSLNKLIENNIIPIINENDSVSFDEITLGDNDQLSALICELMNANTLCMLTKADGLYDRDPILKDAKKFKKVKFDEDFSEVKLASKTLTGKGGMKTKLEAVRKLTPLGIDVFIASFDFDRPVTRAIKKNQGTKFEGLNQKLSSKKAWIITRVRSHAVIKVDAGAKQALLKNSSLLPIGINQASGKFGRGDCVTIKHKSEVLGYGVVEYSASEIEKIKQLKSSELASVLKHAPSKVVIHKNNLILKKSLA